MKRLAATRLRSACREGAPSPRLTCNSMLFETRANLRAGRSRGTSLSDGDQSVPLDAGLRGGFHRREIVPRR